MECEALAERANYAETKARLREAAKQWVDLADRVEQLDSTKDAAEPPRHRSWQRHLRAAGELVDGLSR